MTKFTFSVRKKILTGFLIVAIILGALSTFFYLEIRKIESNYNIIIQEEVSYLLSFQDFQKNMLAELDLIKKYALNKKEDLISDINTLNKKNEKTLEQLSEHPVSKEKQFDFEPLKLMFKNYTNDENKMIDAVKNNKMNVFNVYMDKKFAEALDQEISRILTDIQNDIKNKQSEISKDTDDDKNLVILVSAVTFLITILISYIIAKKISQPVKLVAKHAKLLAEGDLTHNIPSVKNRDEIGDLVIAYQYLHSKLKQMVNSIQLSAQQVASTSVEISAGTEQTTASIEQVTLSMQDLAVKADNLVVKVEETNNNVKQFRDIIKHITDNVKISTLSNNEASSLVNKGSDIVVQAIQQMNDISNSVQDSVQVVNKLSQQSKKIQEIVDLITDISEQTNLLALNAAIEAARAGEHGKGFAVVADEVKKLAEQSGSAAGKVTEMINDIGKDTESVVKSMVKGNYEVKEGIEIINELNSSFSKILNAINNVNTNSENTLTGVEKMEQYVEDVYRTIDETKILIEESASHTQNAAAASEEQNASIEEINSSIGELSRMAEELEELINHFKSN